MPFLMVYISKDRFVWKNIAFIQKNGTKKEMEFFY
jgi:hypothetical protein